MPDCSSNADRRIFSLFVTRCNLLVFSCLRGSRRHLNGHPFATWDAGEFVFPPRRTKLSARPPSYGCWHAIAARTLLAFLVFSLALPAQSSTSAEYLAKANFLATFPSFIDWPDSAFPSPQASILLCVRGDFAFGTSLAVLTRGLSVHGRSLEVRWIRKDEELRSCHIVFVSHSEAKRYTKLLQTLDGASTLTVGETSDFLDAGGAVAFSVKGETLQFEVNLPHANRAHLRISSHMLALARRVVTGVEAAKG